MGRFISIIHSISKLFGYISAIFVLFAVVIIVISVFMRRVLNSPLIFGEDLSSYILLGMVFLGLAYTMMTEGHVRVDLVISKVSEKTYVILEKVFNILGALYALILFVGSFLLIRHFYMKHTISPVLEVPLYIPGILLVLGSFALLLQMVAQLFISKKRIPDISSESLGL